MTSSPTFEDMKSELRLSKSGQFYALSSNLSKKSIEQVLSAIRDELIERSTLSLSPTKAKQLAGWIEIQHSWQNWSAGDCKISILLQTYVRPPLVAPESDLIEQKVGFALLAEMHLKTPSGSKGSYEGRYLYVHFENTGDPYENPTLKEACSQIDTPAFLAQFMKASSKGTENVSRVERLSMRMMAATRGEIRRKVVEAYDVAAATSSLGLHRTIAGPMTVAVPHDAGYRYVALSPHRSTVRASSNRFKLDEVLAWACQCACEFYRTRTETIISSPLLSGMAQPADKLNTKTPSSVLLESHALLDAIKVQEELTGRVWTAGKSTPDGWNFSDVVSSLSDPISVHPINDAQTSTDNAQYQSDEFKIAPAGRLKLSVSSQTCRLELPDWVGTLRNPNNPKDGIQVHRLINEQRLFRVTFDKGTILFCSEGAYGSSDLNVAIQQLVGILVPVHKLGDVVYEKGDEKTFNKTTTQFGTDTAFRMIEDCGEITSSDSILICEDAQDEWCDYLEIAPDEARRLRWLHAKVKQRKLKDKVKSTPAKKEMKKVPVAESPSLSASDLEVVTGQAIKNLGRLRLSSNHEECKKRVKRWQTEKCTLPVENQISRIRRLGKHDKKKIQHYLDTIANDPLATYEVGIVVPNYSYEELKNALEKIPKKDADDNVIQAFWLLSGFMHSCLEVGAKPLIFVHS